MEDQTYKNWISREQEYRESKAINHSSMRYLDPNVGGSPFKYWEELQKPYDPQALSTAAKDLGSAIHAFMFEEEMFVAEDVVLPTGMMLTTANWLASDEGIEAFYPLSSLIDNDQIEAYIEELNNVEGFIEGLFFTRAATEGGYSKPGYAKKAYTKDVAKYVEFKIRTKDKIVLPKASLLKLQAMKEAMQIAGWGTLFTTTIPKKTEEGMYGNEFVLEWDEETLNGTARCKGKLDHFNVNIKDKLITIIDGKSTHSITGVPYDISSLRYYRQMGFYLRGLFCHLRDNGLGLDGCKFEVKVALVESNQPHHTAMVKINESILISGMIEALAMVELVKYCDKQAKTNEGIWDTFSQIESILDCRMKNLLRADRNSDVFSERLDCIFHAMGDQMKEVDISVFNKVAEVFPELMELSKKVKAMP